MDKTIYKALIKITKKAYPKDLGKETSEFEEFVYGQLVEVREGTLRECTEILRREFNLTVENSIDKDNK